MMWAPSGLWTVGIRLAATARRPMDLLVFQISNDFFIL